MKRVHCIHYVVSKNLTTEPVDNSNHKCPMSRDRRVSNVRAPYLIRTFYLAFAQKIREFLMFRMRFRGAEILTRIYATSMIAAACASIYDSLCKYGVSVQLPKPRQLETLQGKLVEKRTSVLIFMENQNRQRSPWRNRRDAIQLRIFPFA